MSAHSGGPSPRAWLAAVRQPELTLAWTLPEWERVVRLSRRLRLLGRLAEAVIGAGLLSSVPVDVRRHLIAESHFSRWQTGALSWAVERIGHTLRLAPYPLVLLKGAAYIGQGLPIALGRLPSDVDILVPQVNVGAAQVLLQAEGWVEAELDAHDQRYYREWSHEMPPMRHPVHGLELDLHHNILPPVAHTRVDAALLLARLQPSLLAGWQVLHPQDQVLHSATHLFHDSEVRDRLRDLVDLDGLLRHFGSQPAFWDTLPDRARELGLSEPLALACHFVTQWLGTPIPELTHRQIKRDGPRAARRAGLHAVLSTLLTPVEPEEEPSMRQEVAAQILLARYHYRRMPLRILLPHLWRKSQARRRAASQDAVAAAAAARG